MTKARGVSALVIVAGAFMLWRRLEFLELIRCPAPERLNLTLPEAVTLHLLRNPLWVFCLGILLLSIRLDKSEG